MARNNAPTEDNNLVNVDVKLSFKAQMSPKLKELLETAIAAGKVITKAGKIAIPVLLALGAALKSLPQQPSNSHLPPTPPIVSIEKNPQ